MLQLLQQFFCLGLVRERRAGAKQKSERRLRVGLPADSVQGDRQVILDVRIAGRRHAGGTQIGERFVRLALSQQDPPRVSSICGTRGEAAFARSANARAFTRSPFC